MNPGRILVIRGGAIGDFVLTLPVMTALGTRFPSVSLDLLGYPHIAGLAAWGRLANAVHPIDARPLAGFFAARGSLDPGMAEFFGRYALIISYLYDPDTIFRLNVARCSSAQFIQGPHRPDPTRGVHATDCFLEPLQRLAIFDADPTPRLTPAESGQAPGPGRWLAVHPGSGSESKNWPEPRWNQFLQRFLQETEFQILLVGGEAEGDRLGRLAAALPGTRLRVARSRPLPELAALLSGCAAFVGHDSGITHLAAAVGLPCVVLWGPSDPAIWRPRGDRIVLLQDESGLAGLAEGSVGGALSEHLGITAETPGTR